MANPIPSPTVPFAKVIDKAGNVVGEAFVHQAWYEFLKGIKLSNLPDVKLTALADTQVLIWTVADGKWENGGN